MRAGKTDYSQLHTAIDAAIRGGQIKVAANELRRLTLIRIPRAEALPFATLFRRIGRPAQGLRLMTPIVHPRKPSSPPATTAELCEYAVLLERSGAGVEALELLKSRGLEKNNEAQFALATCYVGRWDYEQALIPLRQFVDIAATPYSRQVAELNLAAALQALGRSAEARERATTLIERSAQAGHFRIHANALEIRAQAHITQSAFSAAQQDLDQAARLLAEGSGTQDSLFVHKWSAVLEALRSGNPHRLFQFRGRALSQKNWESVREADLFLLKADFDRDRFERLLFGTPFPAYRQKVQKDLQEERRRDSFIEGQGREHVFDVVTAFGSGVAAGSKTHQLIEILSRDFYAPVKIGALFNQLFPGEHFDIFSSPGRVRQIITRARKNLTAQKTRLSIVEESGLYRLRLDASAGLKVPWQHRLPNRQELLFESLAPLLAKGDLSPRAARGHLQISNTSCARLFEWAMAEDKLERMGQGRLTLYRKKSIPDP